jgi:hypothetical protein
VGWQHVIDIDKNSRKVQCNFVRKILVEAFIWLALMRM